MRTRGRLDSMSLDINRHRIKSQSIALKSESLFQSSVSFAHRAQAGRTNKRRTQAGSTNKRRTHTRPLGQRMATVIKNRNKPIHGFFLLLAVLLRASNCFAISPSHPRLLEFIIALHYPMSHNECPQHDGTPSYMYNHVF